MDWALLWRDEGVASPYFTGWPSGIYKECWENTNALEQTGALGPNPADHLFYKYSLNGTPTCSFIYAVCGCFCWQRRGVAMETVWPTKSKMSTFWPFTEKFRQPLLSHCEVLAHSTVTMIAVIVGHQQEPWEDKSWAQTNRQAEPVVQGVPSPGHTAWKWWGDFCSLAVGLALCPLLRLSNGPQLAAHRNPGCLWHIPPTLPASIKGLAEQLNLLSRLTSCGEEF